MENTTTFKTQTTVFKYKDVRGKELMYLKLEANGKELVINIGEKSFAALEDLAKPREEKTVINVAKPEKGGKS